MKTSYRWAFGGAVLFATVILGATASSAAPTAPVSALNSVIGSNQIEIEKASYRWGRRCYRECHVGRHGRLYCTWHCYRPRRWW